MEVKKIGIIILYAIGIFLALASIFFSYTGVPGNNDTEPLLAIGLLFVAIAGLRSIMK